MSKKAYFITVEGIEGVGKSTNVKFLQHYLQETLGIDLVTTREPGGTLIAEDIRQILLTHHQEKMGMDTELLLMFASRAQHLATVIKPALAAGQWVLSDRFTDASYAYQGGGRGVNMARIALLEKWVQAKLNPDLTILLTAPVKLALERAKKRSTPDRFEAEKAKFFMRTQKAYLQRAKAYPKRFRIVHTDRTRKYVEKKLTEIIDEFVKGKI